MLVAKQGDFNQILRFAHDDRHDLQMSGPFQRSLSIDTRSANSADWQIVNRIIAPRNV
jgi:hypothetical protein